MADQPVTREKLINADKDVQTIEDFIKKPKDETVTTRFGNKIMTLMGLEDEVKKSGGYFKRYTTLAAANADIANIPVKSVVKVTDAADGGDYEKALEGATSLIKSAYDPLVLAKNYVLLNVLRYLNATTNKKNILNLSDANNNPVFRIDLSGNLFIPNLDKSVQELFHDLHLGFNEFSSNVYASNNKKNALCLFDSNKNIIFRLDTDGNLFIPNLDKSVQELLKDKNTEVINQQVHNKRILYTDEKYNYTDNYYARLSRLSLIGTPCCPVPLFSAPQKFELSSNWLDSIGISVQQGERIKIAGFHPHYENDIGVVHPQVWSFNHDVAGYKYWMSINPYTNGNEAIELPFIYGSNDDELMNWELIPTFPQPFEVDPITEDGSYRGHLSDSGFCYDPKTGDIVFFWRKSLYYHEEVTGKKSRHALLASKFDGQTWSKVYTLYELTEENHGSYSENLLSPNITYNPSDDLFYMFYVSNVDFKMYRRTSPTLDFDSWSEREQIITNSLDKFWHLDMKFVGNKLIALIHCDDMMSNKTIDKLIFAASDDFLNFTCSQESIISNANPSIYKATFLPIFSNNLLQMKILHTTDSKTSPQYQLFVSDTNSIEI